MKYNICVTCAFGIESTTKRELEKLGYINIPANKGMFCFEGNEYDVARCNMFLRTAERVYIKLAEFPCITFDDLFDGVNKIHWNEYIHPNGQIIVNGKCVKSTIYGISASQSIIKKAIVVSMMKSYGVRTLSESAERYKVEFAIINDVATIYLDTSGSGLHKRGYRDLVGAASIKETLAAAILELSVFNADKEFADPFCGSGTFPIEAAMYALNIAPGKNREFDYTSWKTFNSKAYSLSKEEAQDTEIKDKKLKISGYDIDKNAVKLSVHHAEKAGVRSYIHFQNGNALDISSHKSYGVICTNPPYGERLSNEKEVAKLMGDFSKTFNKLNEWSLYLITALPGFEYAFGKKADKNRKLFNGKIECRLYQYMGAKPPRKEL